MNNDPLKSGWWTSEFWTTVGVVVKNFILFLVMLNVLPSSTADEVQSSLTKIVGWMGMIAGESFILWKYITSRTETKVAAINQQSASNIAVLQASAGQTVSQPPPATTGSGSGNVSVTVEGPAK